MPVAESNRTIVAASTTLISGVLLVLAAIVFNDLYGAGIAAALGLGNLAIGALAATGRDRAIAVGAWVNAILAAGLGAGAALDGWTPGIAAVALCIAVAGVLAFAWPAARRAERSRRSLVSQALR